MVLHRPVELAALIGQVDHFGVRRHPLAIGSKLRMELPTFCRRSSGSQGDFPCPISVIRRSSERRSSDMKLTSPALAKETAGDHRGLTCHMALSCGARTDSLAHMTTGVLSPRGFVVLPTIPSCRPRRR